MIILVCVGRKRERSYSDGPIIGPDREQEEEEVVINILLYWSVIYDI